MAFRHRQHLIFKHLQLIFDGTEGKEKVSAITTYILGVAERSEEQFLEQLKDTTFTIKPEVMSTLEQILERGRKEGREEGREEGLYKNSIFNLVKTALRFSELSVVDLADFTELPQETVQEFIDITAEGDKDKLLDHVQKVLLADIPLSAEETEKLQGLVEQLVAGSEE